MTLREHDNSTAKYIQFTNGFPRKEMVPTQGLSAGVTMHGGFFVGLHDGATSCLTKSQRTIPPLAKRRTNSIALKPRASSSRYRHKNDPFNEHKGTEKTGFTPQSIKHNKPKLERTSPRNEHSVSNATLSVKLGTRLSRPTEHPSTSVPESDLATTNPETSHYKILSDVEKKTTWNELIGIDEVYQKVCNGNMDSLCSLISPVKPKKKLKQVSSAHYIQTSAPLILKQKPTKTPPLVGTELDLESKLENSAPWLSKDKNTNLVKGMTKKRQSILLPLPFFPNPPKPPNTAPARFKEAHNYPKIYPSRLEKQRSGVMSSLSGWSSPSIINFNPVDFPESKRPVSRACAPTGSIVGVQNKSQTGKVAIMAAIDVTATPPATAECETCQQGFINGDNKNERMNGKWESPEVDSLYSEDEQDVNTKIKQNNQNGKDATWKTSPNNVFGSHEDISVKNTKDDHEDVVDKSLGVALSVTLNVTDESGEINEVEIYDPDTRDFEKEEQVKRDIEKAQQDYQKKRHELESLLKEHNSIVQEVNQLNKDLKD